MPSRQINCKSGSRIPHTLSVQWLLRFALAALLATLGFTPLSFGASSKATRGQLKKWKSMGELKGMEAAFEFLEKNGLKDLPAGRQAIDGDNVYAIVTKVNSRDPQSAQFESHKKYIDIHYLIAGAETIASSPVDQLKLTQPYDEAKDIMFYSVPGSYSKLEMQPGYFAVFLPGQAHLPTCHLNGPHEIHKVVVKVSVDYLASRRKAK